MFPRPIEQTSPATQMMYKVALPIALFLWLMPLIGIAVTSLRPASDLAQGNYFGVPSAILVWIAVSVVVSVRCRAPPSAVRST